MKIKALQVGELGTNCYILADEMAKLCAVVDPGGNAKRISTAIEQLDCKLCAIFLTHGHYDHTGGAEELAALWPDVPVYLNRRDANPDSPYMAQLFPVVAGAKDYDEGDEIAVGGLTVTVMATPGHSEGSVTLRCGDVLFCGDTLFAGSCGRTDFPGGSMQKILKSLKRLAQLEGNLQVLPGHMDLSDLDHERRTNPYVLHALERA
jgi:glyoxylase-like metal-dependent hydrolase (beta-lactamase superfamily II)